RPPRRLQRDNQRDFQPSGHSMQRGESMRLTLIVAITMFAATIVAADDTTAIHSKHVLDVKTGSSSEAYVVVRGDRIVSIDKPAPKGAKVIALGAATVLPGLIDSHVPLEALWDDLSATSNLRHSSAEKTLVGLLNAQTYLRHGFTTVRDAGTTDPGYDTIALR